MNKDAAASDFLRYEVRDRVAHIILDRAPVNALDTPMVVALIAAFRRAGEDDHVGAVVLSSAMPTRFCGGFALDFAKDLDGAAMRGFVERLYVELFDVQYRLGKPSIAAMHGAARGAGISIAIACDMIIAADDAHLAYSEIDIGLVPAIHFTHLPRLVGRHRAFELLFSGRRFDADEGERIGLINRVVPRATLIDEAHTLAASFAAKSPALMRIGRAAFMRANDLDYRRSMEDAAETICALVGSPDMQEGFAAFLERRTPQWPSLPPVDAGEE